MPAGSRAVVEAQRTEEQEEARENETKAPLGRELDDLFPILELVSAEKSVLHLIFLSLS